jgi:hypothetical protein
VIVGYEFSVSPQSNYLVFQRHGTDKSYESPNDRNRFELQMVNELLQGQKMGWLVLSDAHTGRKVAVIECILG